ncbi:hypothetical protein GT045_01380 [Streptomyces sp. SID486]|nr:hypothetical protein [Streptomyces sp. SID486]
MLLVWAADGHGRQLVSNHYRSVAPGFAPSVRRGFCRDVTHPVAYERLVNAPLQVTRASVTRPRIGLDQG